MEERDYFEEEIQPYVDQEILEESTKDSIEKLESRISTLWQHMLKYQVQPNKQGSSWLNTMSNEFENVNEFITKNTLKAAKQDEDKIYKDAIRKAMIDINKHATKESDKVTKNDFPQERDESIFNVEVIKNGKGDLKEIEAYLDKYAHNRYAIKAVENIKSGKDYRDNNHD